MSVLIGERSELSLQHVRTQRQGSSHPGTGCAGALVLGFQPPEVNVGLATQSMGSLLLILN